MDDSAGVRHEVFAGPWAQDEPDRLEVPFGFVLSAVVNTSIPLDFLE